MDDSDSKQFKKDPNRTREGILDAVLDKLNSGVCGSGIGSSWGRGGVFVRVKAASSLTLYEVCCELEIESEYCDILFPYGILSVIDMYFESKLKEFKTKILEERLNRESGVSSAPGVASGDRISIRKEVGSMVLTSFALVQGDRLALIAFLKYLLLTPRHAARIPKMLFRVASAIWTEVDIATGNMSKGVSYYSRRASLAALYGNLMLNMLWKSYTPELEDRVRSRVGQFASVGSFKHKAKKRISKATGRALLFGLGLFTKT